MIYKVSFLLIALMSVKQTFAEELTTAPLYKQYDSWSYDHYRVITNNTRTLWFVDYYAISHRQNAQGDNALILTFIPDKLTQQKVRTATIEALEGSNLGINIHDPSIQKLANSLSVSLVKGDVIAIIYNGKSMQVQHNSDVIYQARSTSQQSMALSNIWLGESPVDDLL
ncbi:chalcone isomerase family protein [Motilimonas pumila]|uniref:Chalcone isomerase domain-containing protein n=1 Tax=Motilimonas pumila TaxID=2303987 RepID=A0A418YBG2_9GAMM|nr:chalcone isomerase family protein [Motilimonas pumila]RJG40324.1 hypothetical protein D1Z90_16345 [Motilimonas pumila]